jgi:hypothetical protein
LAGAALGELIVLVVRAWLILAAAAAADLLTQRYAVTLSVVEVMEAPVS